MRLLGMLVLTCAVAYAQPKTKSTELFEQGRALAAAGKLAEACSKFDESYQLDRAPGTALNFGDCLEKLGQLRRAWQMFDGAWRDFARDSDGRADYAKKRASDISAKLVAITVNVADPAIPGLVIEIDGQVVAAQAVIEDRFPPGEITVTATRRPDPDSDRAPPPAPRDKPRSAAPPSASPRTPRMPLEPIATKSAVSKVLTCVLLSAPTWLEARVANCDEVSALRLVEVRLPICSVVRACTCVLVSATT